MKARVDRVLVIVLDGFGVGGAPDAADYGDAGADTIGHVARAVGGVRAPNLAALGLGCLTRVDGVPCAAEAGTAHGAMIERSAAKDSTTGHWELCGLVTERGFPLYPKGFPPEVIEPFEVAIGRKVIGNRPASGTEIIEELGVEHLRTGRPIVYTSGDSVFQIACHRSVADPETLYGWCREARRLLTGEHGVGRVIARPFDGKPGHLRRTPDRRDFSLPPPGPTLADACAEAGVAVYGVGKIGDVFTMRGITESHYTTSNDDGIDRALTLLGGRGRALVLVNLVDLDTKYGHRNDPKGYAACVEAFDARLPEIQRALGGAVLFVTGDHGCDPTTASTDHTREMVPCLVAGIDAGPVDLGVRGSYADLGATVADLLGVSHDALAGESFAERLR